LRATTGFLDVLGLSRRKQGEIKAASPACGGFTAAINAQEAKQGLAVAR